MKSFQPLEDGPPVMDFDPSACLDRHSLGDELKGMFDSLTRAPLPDQMLQLADALEEAFSRGELFEGRCRVS